MFKDRLAKRIHHREYMRRRYNEDPAFKQSIQDRNKRSATKNVLAVKAVLDVFRRGGCAKCPEKAECCLIAHHIDPSTKSFTIGGAKSGKRQSALKITEELKKCICLCENCHRKIHAGLLQL